MNKTVTALCIVVSAFVLLFCVTDFFNMGENKSETTLGSTGGDCDNRSSQSEVQTTHGCNKNHYDETTDTTANTYDYFPEIVKATLYVDGVAEVISPDDSRLQKMADYIMKAYNEHDYPDVAGELEQSQIDDYYKSKAKAYMELELESDADNVFFGYNRAIIVYADVIMIDDYSGSYHGEGNPFNFIFSPYNTGGAPVAPILYICGFTNSSLPYRDS